MAVAAPTCMLTITLYNCSWTCSVPNFIQIGRKIYIIRTKNPFAAFSMDFTTPDVTAMCQEVWQIPLLLLLLLLLLLALQPTLGFSLLSDSLPFCSFFTLLSPQSYSHYLRIFFVICNPSLPWSPSNSRTYRFPL